MQGREKQVTMGNRSRQLSEEVWRIRLDSPCGLVVNVFVVRSRRQVALVDAGFPHTADQLNEGLEEIGLSPAQVTDVLYTHTHSDHMGGGVALANTWNVRDWVWEGTTPAMGDWRAHHEQTRTRPGWPIGFLDAGRRADPLVVEMLAKPTSPIDLPAGGALHDPRGVAFGATVSIGDLEFVCVDARGHDPYHAAWYEPTRRWLFSGDVVLAVPVPLVRDMGDQLGAWLTTLERWERSLEVEWLLPGHGMPTRLFGPSIARARGSLEALHSELCRHLRQTEGADPLAVVRSVLPRDPSRYAARSAILLANVETLLAALEEREVIERCDAARWRAAGELPALHALSN